MTYCLAIQIWTPHLNSQKMTETATTGTSTTEKTKIFSIHHWTFQLLKNKTSKNILVIYWPEDSRKFDNFLLFDIPWRSVSIWHQMKKLRHWRKNYKQANLKIIKENAEVYFTIGSNSFQFTKELYIFVN